MALKKGAIFVMNTTASFDDGGIDEVDERIDRDLFWNRVSDGLRPTQQLVLELILLGMDDVGIAGHLSISEVTVRWHRSVIVRKSIEIAAANGIDETML